MEGQIAIYSRKSKFTGRGESIENQIELCRQYVRAHFGDRDAEEALVYEDEGFSGGTLDRPQFRKMMEAARNRPFRAVVVYRLDRISRNVADFAGLIDALDRLGTGFISIREQFDTTSPMGRAMMYVSSVFSQLERETIAERIRDNMLELSKSGRWLGGVTPTGYRAESITKNDKTVCRLQPVPEELRLVRQIFDCFLRTGSLTKTETALFNAGARTKNGRSFTRFAIRGILTNPVYLRADGAAWDYLQKSGVQLCARRADFDGSRGVTAYNRTARQRGGGQKSNPPDRWIVAAGEHPGLIPGEAWAQVQALLEQNRRKGCRRPCSHTALLSGVLRCGLCGACMRPKMQKNGNFCYMCQTKERSRRQQCSVKNCPGTIDALVLARIAELSGPEALAEALEGLRFEPAPAAFPAELRETRARLARLRGTLQKCAGTGAEDEVLRSIEALRRREAALREALEAEKTAPAPAEAAALTERLSDFGAVLEALELPRRRMTVRALVGELTWDGETARLRLSAAGGSQMRS